MNVTIERGPALAAALARLASVAERRPTIPILSNVLISARHDRVTLSATNLDMEASETIETRAAGVAGETSVPADMLRDIARNAAPGADIALVLGEDADPRARLVSGRSHFSLPALAASDFPRFPSAMGAPFVMPAAQLGDMIARVIWAADRCDTSSLKGCVYLGTGGDELHAVATDGHVLALRSEARPEGAEISASVPGKVARHIAGWLGDARGDVEVCTSEDRLIQVRNAGSVVTAKLDGAPSYFDYGRILKRESELSATTDRDAFTAALRRVIVMLDARWSTAVRLTFSEGCLRVIARGQGEAADDVACDYQGPEATILLNAANLQGALAAMRGDRARFSFSTRHELVVVDAPSGPGFVSNMMQPRV